MAWGTRGSWGGGESGCPCSLVSGPCTFIKEWRRTLNSTWGWGHPESGGEDPERRFYQGT